MGTAMFGISVDTKHLDSGFTHALELEGMDYKFTVSIPQEAIASPGHLVFYSDVPVGKVIARFLLRATGEQWDAEVSEYKELWKGIVHLDLTEEHEAELIPIFSILLAPPESRTKVQKELCSKSPDSMQRLKELATTAHNWAKHMAMRAVETWHSTQTKANSHNHEG